jgi:membrane-bound metal-dependent hydrolase YbcI (DUF457 family)
MPFTPLHMGPGLAIKALAGRHFSLTVFGFTQIAMDIEPLVHILRDDPYHHGFTHTYVGATLLAIACAVIGRPVCAFILGRLRPDPTSPFLLWLLHGRIVSWPAAISAAFIGTYSHVLLDSLMHYDMHPLAPFQRGNAMLHAISVANVHWLCVLSGILGSLLLVAQFALSGARSGR